MELEIEAQKKIEEVQREFNTAFPYLRVEFISFSRQGNGAGRFVLPALRINDFKKNIRHCIIKYPATITVGEFENMFARTIGLPVKILRKSGNLWIETTMTRRWTLERQNTHGRDLSEPKAVAG
ncbi:MAG TPA: hypothetical protein VHB48_08715 [Chitinophagaceae bacterium]|nr:hypothetical protein [Chitinophagaceae bacterium]